MVKLHDAENRKELVLERLFFLGDLPEGARIDRL
jgi:hypothetical protein